MSIRSTALCGLISKGRRRPAAASAALVRNMPQFSLNERHQSTRVEWQHAVSAAEKLVGYPTSYLTLRSLLSDEMSNVATHLRKLVATSHPLMDTAKQMVMEGGQSLQTRGLLVLLLSKAAGRADGGSPPLPGDAAAGVLHSQRSLAEITEMIHTAQLIHKGVVNLHHQDQGSSAALEAGGGGLACAAAANPDYEFGNKIAILCGDYLLANACKALAALQNSQVVGLVSSAISDFTESEFLGERDEQGLCLPSASCDLQLWREKTFLSVGSLLAKSSKSALLLAGHRDQAILDLAFAFGRQLAFAWQGQLELQPFLSPSSGGGITGSNISSSAPSPGGSEVFDAHAYKIDVTCLPVVLHLQGVGRGEGGEQRLREFEEKVRLARAAGQDVDEWLVQEVMAGRTGVPEGMKVVHEHCQEALRLLQVLPETEARTALQNIVRALQVPLH